MNILLENETSTDAKLKVTLHHSDYKEQFDKKIKEYAKTVTMKGFRAGKVPVGLITKLYGTAVKADLVNELVSQNINTFLKEKDIKILFEPIIDETSPIIDFDSQSDFDFSFEIGKKKEVDYSSVYNQTFTKYKIALTDEYLDKVIKNMTEEYATFSDEEIANETSQIYGDIIVEGKKQMVLLPISKVREDNKSLFVGAKIGDSIVFDLKTLFEEESSLKYLFEKDTDVSNLKDLSISITKINGKQAANLDENFFNSIFRKEETKITDLDTFKKRVTEELSRQNEDSERQQLKNDVIVYIRKNTSIDISENFVKKWALKNIKETENIDQEIEPLVKEITLVEIDNKIINDFPSEVTEKQVLSKAVIAMRNNIGIQDASYDHLLIESAKKMIADKKSDQFRSLVQASYFENAVSQLIEKVKVSEKEVSLDEFIDIVNPKK